MTTPNTGYGDADWTGSWVGGYGDHPAGWGHPPNVQITISGGAEKRDLGGERVDIKANLYGTFPAGPYQVFVRDVLCYSGIAGNGSDVSPGVNLDRFSFVMPNLYGKLGPADIKLVGAFGTFVLAGVLTIVRYSPGTSWITGALQFQSPGSTPVWYLPFPHGRAGEV